MKHLAKAIIQVMTEVRGMEKNSKVGSGRNSYDGTKDKDVKEAFNTAMSKAGLCIMPIDIEEDTRVDRWEEEQTYNGQKSIKQKQSIFTKVKVKYLLVHAESGESQEICGYGHGVDSQDKSAGKATTYAMKNALLYTFLTPVGKIDDTDTTHSDEIKPPTQKPKAKPILQPNSSEWNGALDFLRGGGDINKIKSKYQFDDKVLLSCIQPITDKYKPSK